MSDETPNESPAGPKRSGKKGTWRILSAEEYAAETGASLFVRSCLPSNKSHESADPPRHPLATDPEEHET